MPTPYCKCLASYVQRAGSHKVHGREKLFKILKWPKINGINLDFQLHISHKGCQWPTSPSIWKFLAGYVATVLQPCKVVTILYRLVKIQAVLEQTFQFPLVPEVPECLTGWVEKFLKENQGIATDFYLKYTGIVN